MADGTPAFFGLVNMCAMAIIAGHKSVTVNHIGKRPAGFPRGELLSVGTDGSQNYAVHPIKLLAWIHSRTSAQKKAENND